MRVSDIVDKVKIKIDEIGRNDAETILLQDNAEMDTIIRSCISEAARFVIANCEIDFLEPSVITNGEIIGNDMVGRVELPDNFLRLCYAKLSSWKTFVAEDDIIMWNDRRYATLSDPYSTGTYERPKAALVLNPKKCLELYSAKETTDTYNVGVVVEPTIEEGKISIPNKLINSFVYQVAGLTLLTYNDKHADDMFNQALVLMGSNSRIENS